MPHALAGFVEDRSCKYPFEGDEMEPQGTIDSGEEDEECEEGEQEEDGGDAPPPHVAIEV